MKRVKIIFLIIFFFGVNPIQDVEAKWWNPLDWPEHASDYVGNLFQRATGVKKTLDDAENLANNIAGEAGKQMRETIKDLDKVLDARMEQLVDAQKEILAEALDGLDRELAKLERLSKELLQEISSMVNEKIECIDKALAERINQIIEGFENCLLYTSDAADE